MRGIRAFFIGVLVVGLFAWAMSGCSTIQRLADSPIVVRLAVSQAVRAYIDNGETSVDVADRREDLIAVFSVTLDYMHSDLSASVHDIFDVFVSQVDLDSMTRADQLLVIEAVQLVQHSLERRVRRGELPEDTIVLLRSIVQTAIVEARYL